MAAVSSPSSSDPIPTVPIATVPFPPGVQRSQKNYGVDRYANRCADQSTGYSLSRYGVSPVSPYSASQYGVSRWSTLRFRRAKDKKGWALLGIPLSLYPLVVQRLFEEQAKFIAKYRLGGFVNLRFEAPQTLAATLAMTFPAPPGSEPLLVNEKGDRILAGASRSADKARIQTIAPH